MIPSSDPRIARILTKVASLWEANPHLHLGQLIERVEDVGWDICPQRVCSPRLSQMGDDLFEAALNARLSR